MSVSWCRLLQDHVTFVVPPSTHKGKEHTIATHGCRIISAHPEDCLLYHQTVLFFLDVRLCSGARIELVVG